MSDLIRTVKEKLLVLPEYVRVYPGHNEETHDSSTNVYTIRIFRKRVFYDHREIKSARV